MDKVELNRERARAWYHNNKEKAKKRLYPLNKLWRANNREKTRKYSSEYTKKYPWVKTYRSICSRCHSNPFYKNKGIKAKIGVVDLKKLWIRDEAFNMKHPSIDRIDRNGDYTFENCRFIELSENLKLRAFETIIKKCKECSNEFKSHKIGKYCSKKCKYKNENRKRAISK